MVKLDDDLKKDFADKHYGIVGRHSAVEICSWNKKSILRKGTCYKEKFYGVHAHKCAQITPMVAWCEQNCLHCWRPMEMFKPPIVLDADVDSPEFIIYEIVKQRKKLLTGFGGNDKVNRERYEDALEPDHWAISLSGEATLYPNLPELIKRIRQLPKTRTIFLVTNGQEPEMLQRLADDDALPTQLYISVIAPNEQLYKKLALPYYKDGWVRLLRSLSIWKEFNTRKVIRITHIKGINDDSVCAEQFAELIQSSEPDFVEVKAYMHIGYSRRRLEHSNMPVFKEVQSFSHSILALLRGYSCIDDDESSRIVLLRNDSSGHGKYIF